MEYLTGEDIAQIHSMIIDETGGSHGIRDRHVLATLEGLPQQQTFGKELYPTPFLKAAVYVRNIIFGHPFIDGNKRTAMTAAGVFLENNGYAVTAEKGEVEKFVLYIIEERLELGDIAEWLKKHSRKNNKRKK